MRNLCILLVSLSALLLCGCVDDVVDLVSDPEFSDVITENPTQEGFDSQDQYFARLHSNPREAIRLEAYYSLNRGHYGGSSKMLGGWTISDWNYLLSDLNAYNIVKGWYGPCSSMWYGPHSSDPGWNGVCSPYKQMGNACFYDHAHVYGAFGSYGRGGQCKYFANLVLYRSGVYFKFPGVTARKLPTYSAAYSDYVYHRRYTKPAHQARIGDVLMMKSYASNPHTAIVVHIISGSEGSNVTALDVVDANWVTWGGRDEEVIGRHIINTSGSWGKYTELSNYFAVDVVNSQY